MSNETFNGACVAAEAALAQIDAQIERWNSLIAQAQQKQAALCRDREVAKQFVAIARRLGMEKDGSQESPIGGAPETRPEGQKAPATKTDLSLVIGSAQPGAQRTDNAAEALARVVGGGRQG